MQNHLSVKRLVRIAMVAAIYVAFTLAIAPLSYGAIQFRLSEILVLLCFYNKDYIISLTLGCAIANLFSPMMALDVPFGTLATLIAVILIYNSRNLILASIFPVIANGIIIGIELYVAFKEPLWISMATVALGELVVVSVLGVPIFMILQRNSGFMKLIYNQKKVCKE